MSTNVSQYVPDCIQNSSPPKKYKKIINTVISCLRNVVDFKTGNASKTLVKVVSILATYKFEQQKICSFLTLIEMYNL